MLKSSRDTETFEVLFAGTSADEIQHRLNQLTTEDRQAVLCTACYLLDEVAAKYPQRAQDIWALIEAQCPFHCSARKVCKQAFVAQKSLG